MTCLICGAGLDYSAPAKVRGYCDVCVPDECRECGCVNIKQRINGVGLWECDNGCTFEAR